MVFRPHPYQTNLINQTRSDLVKHKGALIVSPAGSGKSVVIADIVKKATERNNHVLFIVHRKELAEQIEDTFSFHEVNMQHVTIMTVGRAVNRLDKLPSPSLIITDESHHSRAASYLKIYDAFPHAYKLGFTASPWRMNGKGFDDIYDVMVEGPNVKWLIENNFLAPYTYYAPTLADLDQLKKTNTGDYSKKSMDKAMNRTIFGDVIKHYKELADGKQAILYAHSVENSQLIAESFKRAGINAAHADSKTPHKERDYIMTRFKSGDIKILCNVDLISEGFNVPDCEVVILMRPTASLVLHIQQSMRSMRYKPGKKAIIIDHVGNYEQHGLPDTEREWDLKGVDKKRKTNTRSIGLTDCPHCYGVIPSGTNPCSLCGEAIIIEQSDLDQVEGELKQINPFEFETDYRITKYKTKKLEELNTLEDFYLYAKARGYKETWIKHQHPDLKSLSWPQFFIKLKPLKKLYN